MDFKKLAGFEPDNIPQIKLQPLANLPKYDRNARTHSGEQVAQLEASMLEWGWTNPMLVDDIGIVAGHGRGEAAERIYARGEQIKFPNGTPIPIGYVPVVDCSGWSPEQRKAYILADNQLAANAGWDFGLLSSELKLLEDEGYDLGLIGFDDDQLAELLADGEATEPSDQDPDATPPTPDYPASVPGDVWQCGAHRVCCGSATVIDDWDRLMQGELADAVWTDPPYRVDQGRKNRELDKWDGGDRGSTGSIDNDKMSPADFLQFLTDAFAALYATMKPGAPIYVAHADIEGTTFRNAFVAGGMHLQSCLVWRKNAMVLGRMDWQSIHEPILYGYKKGSRHRWYGGRKNVSVIELGEGGPFTRMEDGRYQIKVGDSVLVVSADAMVEESPTTVLYEPKPARSDLHPTQKPVALVERMLKQSARAGDIIADAFGGSGTTLLAADRLGMSARLMELDPRFVDVIVRRWEQYTGRRAVHAATGEEFPLEGQPRQAPSENNSHMDDDIF